MSTNLTAFCIGTLITCEGFAYAALSGGNGKVLAHSADEEV